jgi:repressor LexA
MDGLTERQRSILGFISRHCADQGYPPTVREIGFAVGLASPSTVHAHLAKLEEAGLIRRDPTKPRAMFVCGPGAEGALRAPAAAQAEEDGPPAGSLPLVGAVAAGAPRLAEEAVEDWVPVPFEGDFLLRVTGDSMVDAGIFDGDLVAVRSQPTAEDGEVVVARIDEEATVKTLRRRAGRVCLEPANDAYAPIISDDVVVLGRVTGVLRSM